MTPTPGALRAAQAIQQDTDGVLTNNGFIHASEIPVLAEIIDRETGVREMLEALKAAARYLAFVPDPPYATRRQIEAAIQKA